jgi:hypothetical protein
MSESPSFPAGLRTSPGLTPRQDRLEAKVALAIASGSPRSTLRDAVVQLVDHLRLQGVPASRGVATITEAAARAANAVGSDRARAASLPIDWATLVSSWASARYSRAD